MKVVVDLGISKVTLNESKIQNLFSDVSCLESIILMLLNDENTWENQQEVEFTRAEAKEFLTIYFAEKNYNKDYIEKDTPQLIKNNIDYKGIAEDMKYDYTEVTYQGNSYLGRA